MTLNHCAISPLLNGFQLRQGMSRYMAFLLFCDDFVMVSAPFCVDGMLC